MPRPWQIVKKTKDFRRITSLGQKYSSPAFLLFHFPCEEAFLGLIVSKKVGSAVKRNRSKRLLRVVFAQINPLKGEFVFIAKAGIERFSLIELTDFFRKIHRKVVPNI
jgi:ribonuclease P protein component